MTGGAAVQQWESEAPRITVAQALGQARRQVPDAGEAELLLAHVLGCSRSWLYAHDDEWLEPTVLERFVELVGRRHEGEPIAYIVGHRGFWAMDLEVTGDTLIPRVETELLVEAALERLPEAAPCRVADLGTGSGAVALAIARERPQAQVLATDVSLAALAVARRNARALAIDNVQFRSGDWCQPLDAGDRLDMIVSNPPYIADSDPHLACGDLRFEPAGALASGSDGLNAIRSIVRQAPGHLRSGGWLLIEHGCCQGGAVRDIFSAAGLREVITLRDLEQRERATIGRTA